MNNLFKVIYRILDTLLHTNIIHIDITKNENKEELRNLQSLGYINIISEHGKHKDDWAIEKNCSNEEIKKIKSWYEFVYYE